MVRRRSSRYSYSNTLVVSGVSAATIFLLAGLLPRAAAQTPPGTLVEITSTKSWNIWSTQAWVTQFGSTLTPDLVVYPDKFVDQLTSDFGYTIFPVPTSQGKLDLVLDPLANGTAHTNTVFGPWGVTVDSSWVNSSFGGELAFWYKLLSLHETINVWAGAIASNWPWANGSTIWAGSSAFPNMVDIVVLSEIGETTMSSLQAFRELSDPRVAMLYNIQQTSGWLPYQRLFQLTRSFGITDWHAYAEPLRTAIVILFMSNGAGRSLLPDFQGAGLAVTDADFAQAQQLFPTVTF